MIKLVERNKLDVEKYNACIEASKESLMYAYSWYLDIVCDKWKVLVLDDYEAVMPIPVRKKYLIQYVYPPLWVLQLGIFSQKNISYESFIKILQNKFQFVELRLNANNRIEKKDSHCVEMGFQVLDLTQGYELIKKGYQSDRKKDLKRAFQNELSIEWGRDGKELIHLFQNNVGQRTPEIGEQDYQNLENLITTCKDKNSGEVCTVYQNNQIVASAFFLKHKEMVTILCSSTDFSNRKNGANAFLIDEAIQRYLRDYKTFNFGGSSIQSIAKYFFSFGAKQQSFPMIIKKAKLF